MFKSIFFNKYKNLRADLIRQVLNMVVENVNPERFNFLEIGCMFNEREGFSTYEIAKFIKEKELKAHFTSIEYNSEHVDAAHSLISKYDESLVDMIDFRCGHSLEILPSLLEEMGDVHFAFLDGGAHPDICLKEFELIAGALSNRCAVIVDDMVELKPTENYPASRPLGKCTLIYPALVMSDYLRARRLKQHMAPDFKPEYESTVIKAIDKNIFGNLLEDGNDFVPIGDPNGHRMLVYGNSKIIRTIKNHT